MDIKITKRIDKDYINEALLVWKFSKQKLQKDTVIISIMSILLFILGIIRTNYYGSFWNPWSSLGIASACMAAIYWIDLYNRKAKVISRANECITSSIESHSSIELLFTDALVSVRDTETYVEFKWTVFSSYQLYQNYLLMFANKSGSCVIQIDKTKLPVDTWEATVNFIATKLPVKK